MNFKKFTEDAKIAIQKLELYGLSCLTLSVNRKHMNITKTFDIRIYSQPTNWKESGAIAELVNCELPWSFQLNLIPPNNIIGENMIDYNIILGFIMLPKRKQNLKVSDKDINAIFSMGSTVISTFQFTPFKFIPAIEHTYFIAVASRYYRANLYFNEPVNYDIYCLVSALDNPKRQYCLQTVLNIPIDNEFCMKYIGGMTEVTEHNNNDSDDYDLTINVPKLSIPKLPFDKYEFIERTHHPDRVFDWCIDTEQQTKWK